MTIASDSEMQESSEPAQNPRPSFTLVGLGASAGGIQALQTFFTGMPPDTGMAFVVVMHLSPDYESRLADVLQARTAMPVLQVVESVQVAPNHVYVIAPNKHLFMQNDRIELVDPQQPLGRRHAIDLFFRTLSATWGPRAVSIVLSGSDSDGVIGIKHVKEQGGLTIAQDPEEAEYDSMPGGAIVTGMIDWVLPVAEMPPRLLEFMRNETRMHIPPENVPESEQNTSENNNSGGPVQIQQTPSSRDEDALGEVLRFLRGQTGHDFSHYKRATVLRRVARRLQVNLMEDIPSYLSFLRSHPAEVTALLHDLLISVTNFFRDRDAFTTLENHVPQLFANKQPSDQVRVWVCGCATGEEAYSIAILLQEHAARLDNPPSIQVFATDLDDDAIQAARAGQYPATIEVDLSHERLRRFFQPEHGGYRVRKELREIVLFSAHNVLKDPPFSRLDLVTCRNLLIYLKREAQENVFEFFHFALRTGGLLFLGSSENMEEAHALFASADKRARLFVRRASSYTRGQFRTLSAPPPFRSAQPAPVLPRPLPGAELAKQDTASLAPRRAPVLRTMHLTMLERYAPPSIIVSASYDILHLSEHAGQFLQFPGGEASSNLLKVIRPALRSELRTALFQAVQTHTDVTASRVPVELGGASPLVNIHVRPAHISEEPEVVVLVVFEPVIEEPGTVQIPSPAASAAPQLEEENQHLREQLSATIEQYESSVEELKASNEELQAMNEEIRSAAEELETSKEELQSINEELHTVNQELKGNLEELSRVNSDLQNLMVSTEIGTIFLDRQMRINRFTPRIQELFNLIATDIGRPISDITHKLSYQNLSADMERVLRDLHSSEREVSSGGRWFLARILPYRTIEDRIDGVVLTFVDITQRKQAEAAMHRAQESLTVALEAAQMGTWDYSAATDTTQLNLRHSELFGYASPPDSWGLETGKRHILPEDQSMVDAILAQSAETGAVVFEARVRWPDGGVHWVSVLGRVYYLDAADGNREPVRMAGVSFDITARKEAEETRTALERETTLLQERNRMSQDLHDTLAQGFTAIKLQLEAARYALEETPPNIQEGMHRIVRSTNIARQSQVEAQSSIHALRLPTLQNATLPQAFEQMAQNVTGRTPVQFILEGTPYALPALIENSLYRIGQEAVTNAVRHSQARRITLSLVFTVDGVTLEIQDDGHGFDTLQTHAGNGIAGMQERALRLGADLHITSRPDEGTCVTLSVPRK